MAYIPKNATWYIAELVIECNVEGNPHNVIHVNVVLVRAYSPEEAFEKAEELGDESNSTYLNPKNQTVTFTYRGLRDLNVIHDELEHGAELMFEEKIGICESKLQQMLTPKSQLAIFRPLEPIDPSKPDYSSKEIMNEVAKRMSGDVG
ncbi:DUF4288 domain-containing protein [Nostoc sp.]|uniref:DUF4288 domain-containing protein n=1 Tax=Nostoc sp. TaxID=1180 RepID=UPI002FFBF2DC